MKWITRGNDSRDHAVTLFTFCRIVGSDAFAHHEGVGSIARIVAANFWLRHLPIPVMDVDLIFKPGMAY